MRVAVLGGSSVATVQLAQALHDWPGGGARRPALELCLHGRSADKLRAVTALFAKVSAPLATVASTHDLAEALDGADVVLVQVRIGGLAARQFDESFPWEAGLPGEETLGPGGFANCLRTVSELEKTWAEVSVRCPQAVVVILTNPAGIVRQSAAEHDLAAVEVCDSPVVFLQDLATRLDQPWQALAPRYVGLNHAGWYLPATDQELDLLAEGQVVPAEVVRAMRAVPLPYLRYYFDADRLFAAQRDKPTRAEQLRRVEEAALLNLAAGKAPEAERRPAPWYRLGVVPVLDAVANGSDQPLLIGVANGDRAPWLPASVTVEALTHLHRGSVFAPLPVPDPPPLARDILSRHALYEELALQAVREPKRENVLVALLANPMVSTLQQAEKLAEVLLRTLTQR